MWSLFSFQWGNSKFPKNGCKMFDGQSLTDTKNLFESDFQVEQLFLFCQYLRSCLLKLFSQSYSMESQGVLSLIGWSEG